MKIGDEVYIHGYVDEIRQNVVIIRNEGGYFGTVPEEIPQQRTGRWIEVIDETDSFGNKTWHHECSICGSDKSGWGTYKHCPDCGTKMEVEE